ncbi:MAG: glycerol-3-phosphate acyltransferase [bacterium]|nr:glycerol-3-phosphate acyltransferase [bacterium]
MESLVLLLIICNVAYLAGSINFSILLFKILKKDDPRNQFSGNAGTSNVYRQAGVFWAALVLLLDIGRSIGIAALSIYYLPPHFIPWTGFVLILGNRYPCFHQFKGGKGVGNYIGFTAFIAPIAAGASCLAWVLVYGIVRVTFIASFFMVLTLAVGTIIILDKNPIAITGVVVTALFIFYNHKQNLADYAGKKTPSKSEK